MVQGLRSAEVNSRSEKLNGWVTVLAQHYGQPRGSFTCRTHFDFGPAVGTWPWSNSDNSGSKGRFVGNSTTCIAAPMNVGIVIDCMVEATVQGHALNRTAPRTSFGDNVAVFRFHCAPGDIVADANTSDPDASGGGYAGAFCL
jgi:hypothetical protein